MRTSHGLLPAFILAALIFSLGAPTPAAGQAFDPWRNDFTPATGRARPGDANPGDSGPWSTRTMLAFSPDGKTFIRSGEVVADQAGVPAVLVDRDGYLRIYYQAWQNNQVDGRGDFPAFAIRNSKGQWFFHKVVMDNWTDKAVDSHVVLLPDGRYRLYFMEDVGGGKLRICSGTGSDGKHFVRDEGFRLDPGDDPVYDPMVLKVGSRYLLVAGPNGAYHAYSDDGLNFTPMGPFLVGGRQFMAWSGVELNGGGYRLYGNFKDDGMLTSLHSADGRTWSEESGWRINPEPVFDSEGGGPLPDNGAGVLNDGTYVMSYLVRIP